MVEASACYLFSSYSSLILQKSPKTLISFSRFSAKPNHRILRLACSSESVTLVGDVAGGEKKRRPRRRRGAPESGDPLGRKDLGKLVVRWMSEAMRAMATDFVTAEVQGEFSEIEQRIMGAGLTFLMAAQPYFGAVPMPNGVEAVCLKACAHYPTVFDNFQRELKDVLQGLQKEGVVEDWRETQSWKLLKGFANSGGHSLL